MKELPILFSTDMVKALLEGRKTQTRRACADNSENLIGYEYVKNSSTYPEYWKGKKSEPYTGWVAKFSNLPVAMSRTCPYGNIGDVLYVRETFWQVGKHVQSHPEDDEWRIWNGRDKYHHWATDGLPVVKDKNGWGVEPGTSGNGSWIPYESDYYWRKFPSIHMPKEAARIWLKVTDIRVERLQDISAEDAKAEGAMKSIYWMHKHEFEALDESHVFYNSPDACTYKNGFEHIWRKINGDESWDANPWVWVISFEVLSTTGKPKNLDQIMSKNHG